jgi:putative membrane protein
MKKLAILLGGAIALAACSSTPRPPSVADLSNPLLAPGYLSMAASSDQFEIQSGQLAQSASRNPQVVNLGQMFVRDHTQSTQMLMSAAQSARVPLPPPTMLPQHQALMDQLRAAGTGTAFDQAFQQIQIQAHQQALQLHQGYAQGGDVPALRAVAGQIVPVVQTHLNALQSLQVVIAPPPPPPPPPVAPPTTRRAGERG